MTDTYTVQRSIHIDAAPAVIYERIIDLHRWPEWSPYEGLDPKLRRSYGGAESGVGSVYEWAGNLKAGAGRMEIVDAVDAARVVIDLRFSKPLRSTSTATFSLQGAADGTDVTWSMTGPVTLSSRVMGVFTSMDRLVGPAFERGLAKLKGDAETA